MQMRLEAELHEKSKRPDLENCKQLMASMLFFSLYLPILPSVRKSIKLMLLSSRPMAIVFTLSRINFTADIPH